MDVKFNKDVIANNKRGSYSDLNKDWNTILEGFEIRSVFSMYDFAYNHKGDVLYPNFESKKPIVEGCILIVIEDWNSISTSMLNPTWRDIAIFFNNNHDGHHGFLEGVKFIEGYLELRLICGS